MKKVLQLMPSILFLGFGSLAFGDEEEIEGKIYNSGSGINQTIQIISGKNPKEQKICADDEGSRLKKLTDMTVRVKGVWKISPGGERECLHMLTFTVLRHTSGRAPLVGVIHHEGGLFLVIGEDGAKQLLGDVPDGLKKMVGKKVILDVKIMATSGEQTSDFRIVTYAEYPEK